MNEKEIIKILNRVGKEKILYDLIYSHFLPIDDKLYINDFIIWESSAFTASALKSIQHMVLLMFATQENIIRLIYASWFEVKDALNELSPKIVGREEIRHTTKLIEKEIDDICVEIARGPLNSIPGSR